MEYYKPESNSKIKWIVLAALAAVFALVLWFIQSGISAKLDDGVMQFAYAIRDDYLSEIMKLLTRAGDSLIVAIICVILIVLPTRVRFGIPVAATAAGAGLTAWIIQFALKQIIARDRPDQTMWLTTADGYSFPSGHAAVSFVFYLFLMVIMRRYLILSKNYRAASLVSVVLPALVAVIGGTRIYLGVHYLTDVLGGWTFGCIILIIFIALYDNYYPAKNKITFDSPSWEYNRRKKPWRKPQVSHPTEDLIDFPKNRSKWKRPVPSKRGAEDAGKHSGSDRKP
jgi:undecaprenyl-diphosphatase